jgi:NAD(P)-dependent dehydrogenase (short-subunit alcohol dehydrogenase family)
MYNPFSLEGKTILVTGASSGIGQATAIECSKIGSKVVITARNEKRLHETLEQMDGTGHTIIIADLNNEDGYTKLLNDVPIIDGLVNCAGTLKTLPFLFISSESLSNIMNVNFIVPSLMSAQLIKRKKFSKKGSIVFISSIGGPIVTHPGNSMYAASKGAITAIVKNMAIELAYKNIRVNCVLPGMVETPLIHSDSITQEQLDADMKSYPLKRYGKPEEIAFAVIYLLSDASSWVTGSNLVIDGGFTLQ